MAQPEFRKLRGAPAEGDELDDEDAEYAEQTQGEGVWLRRGLGFFRPYLIQHDRTHVFTPAL